MSKRLHISIYLLKKSRHDEFNKMTRTLVDGVPLQNELEGKFFPLPGERKPPNWLGHVETVLNQDENKIDINSEHAAGLLYIYLKGELFVIPFGTGWQKIDQLWVVPDFGRKVALNSISADSLVGVRAEQVMAGWHISDERSPVATNVKKFAVEFDRDLVSVIEGRTEIKEFGEAIRGGTSLRVSVDFNQLQTTLEVALQKYSSNAYVKYWPEIDNLTPVLDTVLITDLDNELDTLISRKPHAIQLTLATPLLREGVAVTGISYIIGRWNKNSATTPYLSVGAWESWLARHKKSKCIKEAKDTPVHLLDHNSDRIKKVSIYECFGCEIPFTGRQYILSSGQWYEVEVNYVKKVNGRLSKIKAPNKKLQQWDGKLYEDQYNELCMHRDRYKDLYDMDAKCTSYGGGHSRFEFCDLLSLKDKTLYFAKIPTKASDCSHLVEQVRRTVELFYSANPEFRNRLKKVIKKYYPQLNSTWLDKRPMPQEWQLCLVLLGKAPLELPFFARCGLYILLKELEKSYFDVRVQSV